jgi:hypothetical protein
MLSLKLMRQRGGYDTPAADRCIRAERPIDDNAPTWLDTHVTLYDVRPDCR